MTFRQEVDEDSDPSAAAAQLQDLTIFHFDNIRHLHGAGEAGMFR